MKNIFFSIIALASLATITVSCNQTSNKTSEKQANDSTTISKTQDFPSDAQNDTASNAASTDTLSQEGQNTAVEQTQNFTIAPVIKDYLALKNALASDNDKGAANAAKQLFATFKNVDMKAIPASKHKQYMDIADNAKENAAHIGENAGKIDHQREHLASLSKDVSDLIALFGTTQKLYQHYCPMYNNGKGAVWISEAKAIKNPYYGSQMLSCGSVKKQF